MTAQTSNTANSADGTLLAWTAQGDGRAIVMVAGVMASRERPQQPGLANALSERFRVLTYDRRGSGESGTTANYAVEREFEDLACMLELAGPDAVVYGFSSGATLALLAAANGVAGSHLLLLEPPLIADPDLAPLTEARQRLDQDPAQAREWFNREITGIPEEILAQFPPPTAADLANASTMLHELTFLPGSTAEQFGHVQVPALVMASDHTAPVLLDSARALGATLPRADLRILPGGWHGLDDATLLDAITDFLGITT